MISAVYDEEARAWVACLGLMLVEVQGATSTDPLIL